MSDSRESFLLFKSFYYPTKDLSKSLKGELYDAIFLYQIEGKEPKKDSPIFPFFLFFKNQFRLDDIKYNKRVNANIINGQKGGRPRNKESQKKPKNPMGFRKAKKGDNDNVNVNVNVNDNVNDYNIIIPDFIKADLWNAFIEMRNQMKAAPTRKAVELIIDKLISFQMDGLDPNESLRLSIENNWRGVFKAKKNNPLNAIEEFKKESKEELINENRRIC